MCAAVVLYALPTGAGAQDTAAARGVDPVVAGLKPASVVRLSVGGARIVAPFVRLEGATLWLGDAERSQSVPLASVDSLWVRRRATGRGALIGGVIVGTAFAVLLGATCGIPESDCDISGGRVTYAAIGLVVGGVVGGVAGGGIGFLAHRWQLRIP